ncbi:hypothetical protein [Paraburkholderia sp. 22B1P]|uniref:hypothetical protein n=1 Tax=Paraburkholderia sp. 22B1P TaxID=3080498 RepID=UPI003092C00D|nr:transglycosylase SLT domain-containing protein [Paraburkholderia sp. 22B1P]
MTAVDDWLGTSMNAPSKTNAAPVDAWLGAGVQPTASAPAAVAALSATAPAPPSRQTADAGLAQDLAAGGADPDLLNQMWSAAKGGAHGIASMFNNAANFVEKGVAGGVNMVPGLRDTALAKAINDTANADVAAQSATDKQFAQTASPGEKAAAFIAPVIMPMGAAMRGANAVGNGVAAGARMIPGIGTGVANVVGKTAGSAALGAGFGAAAPVDSSQPYLPQVASNMGIGAALGVAAPAAFQVGKSAVKAIGGVLSPIFQPAQYVGQGLAGSMDPSAAASVASNIRNAQQFVPNSLPTTAQVSNSPFLVQTEKALANSSPEFRTSLVNRGIDNNNARWDVINSIARSPQDLTQAVNARNAAAQPSYDAFQQLLYDVDPTLNDLMKRPAMKQALQRGINIAENRGNTSFINATAPIDPAFANVPTGGTAMNGAPVMQQVQTATGSPGKPAQVSGEVLHYLKLGLDDMIQNASESTRVGPFERTAMEDARTDYLNWLNNASSDYAAGAQRFRSMSPPINTMVAGQALSGDLGRAAPNSSGVPQIGFPTFKARFDQALKSDPDVARFGIEPDAQKALQGIQSDLQREMISNSVRSSGSDTAYNLAANGWLADHLFGPTFGGATSLGKGAAALATAATGHPIAALGVFGAGNKVGQMVGKNLTSKLGGYMLDPATLLPYLDSRANVNGSAVNGLHQAVQSGLLRYGRPAVLNGLLGQFQNP